MSLTSYTYRNKHSIFHALSEGYKNPEGDHWKTTGAFGGLGQYISHHPYKMAAAVAAVSLTTLYFVSASYAAFVHSAAGKVAGCVVGAAHTIAAWHGAAVSGLGNAILFIGAGLFTQILVGVVMAAAAVAITYGLYKGVEKIHSCLTSPKPDPVPTGVQGISSGH